MSKCDTIQDLYSLIGHIFRNRDLRTYSTKYLIYNGAAQDTTSSAISNIELSLLGENVSTRLLLP